MKRRTDERIPSKEDIDDLAAITRVILEYLFTMPAKVAKRPQKPIQKVVPV